MPTISAASTPSRRVIMKACNMKLSAPYHFENEFQFQLNRIVCGAEDGQRAASQSDVIRITRSKSGSERRRPAVKGGGCDASVRAVSGTAVPVRVRETAFPRRKRRRHARSGGSREA